ncbi:MULTISPECIES: hypothetical protein [Bradyrhizobium]
MKSLDGARTRLTSQIGGRLFDFHFVRGNQQVNPSRAQMRANS